MVHLMAVIKFLVLSIFTIFFIVGLVIGALLVIVMNYEFDGRN